MRGEKWAGEGVVVREGGGGLVQVTNAIMTGVEGRCPSVTRVNTGGIHFAPFLSWSG